MEFLDTIETIRAEVATVQRLYNGEGQSLSARVRKGPNPRYLAQLAEAAALIAGVKTGKKPSYLLEEAMSTSDFPILFGDVLDRTLLASYREAPRSYPSYCRVAQVRDFREKRNISVNGADSELPIVPELTEYPEAALNEAQSGYRVSKVGRRIPFSWEARVNDYLDVLSSIPERFGRAARRTEEKTATRLFVSASGPSANLYTAGNGNIVTGNPALTTGALQAALNQLGQLKDENGEPIIMEAVVLVVPRALELTARNIVNTTEITVPLAGGGTQKISGNGLGANLTVVVNYYIPSIATNANAGTSWFLFASPSSDRPALELGFLAGHSEPEIFIKSPNARRIGGGDINPLDGDFDTDAVEYKVRHVVGGGVVDFRSTLASNGSGVA